MRRRTLHAAAYAWVAICGLTPALAATPEAVEEITVTGEAPRERDPVGPWGQPEWTTRRRYGNADVYVQPEGQVELAASWILLEPNRDGETLNRFRQEIEVGLPYRLQLDFELTEDLVDGDGEFQSVGVEGRWALANWGEIPFNPAVYAEYEITNAAADEIELKLIGGDNVSSHLTTAVNLFVEAQLGDEAGEAGGAAPLIGET